LPAANAQQSLPASFQQLRKQSSRERLLAAAAKAFCEAGYFAVSVEDIASAAGVSRMTFYRHFSGKAALAIDLFRENAGASMPRFIRIANGEFRDHAAVAAWIHGLFEADRKSGQLLRVFIQANAEESGFTQSAQELIGTVIVELGKTIPAFALDRTAHSDRHRWLEAWLLIYEILDQSNHAARGSGIATDPLVVEILANRFVRFVETCDLREVPAEI
jgi:AcrR family transcriptional regulator